MGQGGREDDDVTVGWRPITATLADHARRRPNAPAVEAQGERRSYADLVARIDVFAARLSAHLGHGDQLVGLCLARDVDLPAWLLAVLKVGAAYLPLDPTLPASRLAHILEDGQPTLIVASRRYAQVVAGASVRVLVAEDDEDHGAPVALPDAAGRIGPHSLAYVIFTSGSTGRPKGVEIEHGSLVALLTTMAASPGFAPGERMLGLTRISFDLSVPDMFLPFFAGGSLALVELDVAADPDRLAAAFDLYRPDLAQGTPSTWRTLLDGGWQGQPTLRILAGGEAVTRALADRLLPRCKELWNIYGPTETTVWSTACQVHAGDDPIPIGWPMMGMSVQVVDGALLPVRTGDVGEIVIGGTGVARGYRNRPELTAERFVAGGLAGRVYRTGDLGRFDEMGALYCLGRLDDQVKVRGFRIELGDVEAALALHPDVAWSAVRVWTDPSGEDVLVGYVVPRGAAPGTREIKAFLGSHLAPYMVPDRIASVAVMPLTPNGKVDRAALTSPFGEPGTPAQAGGTTQDRLATIWRDLLSVAVVAPDDDFFDLGGYSLMTVRLTRRIDSEFGLKLALIEIMRFPTLASMAARIDRGHAALGADAMLLNGGGGRPALFWLDAGPLMRTITRGLASDQPAYALNTDAADEERLGAGDVVIAQIASCLRTRLTEMQPSGPYYLGGWCRWGIVAFELARQLESAGETVGLLVLLDAERPGARTRGLGLRRRLRALLRAPAPGGDTEPPSFSQRVEIATHSYVADRYSGDVLLFRPEDSVGDAGWSPLVAGDLEVAHVPGDHESMVRGSSAQLLAAKMDRALRAAQKRWSNTVPIPNTAPARADHARVHLHAEGNSG